MERYKSILFPVFVFSFLTALLSAVVFFVEYETALGSDLVSFLTGANIIREGKGGELFDLGIQYTYQQKVIAPARETSVLPFENLPILAFLLIPLTYLPLLFAYRLFALFLILVYLLSAALAAKIFKGMRKGFLWIVLPFLFYPSLGSVFSGQTTPLLVLILFFTLYFLKKKDYFAAGLVSGLLFIKIQYIIFIPFGALMAKDKKAFIRGGLLSFIFLLATSVALVGVDFVSKYLNFIFSVQRPEFGIRVADMFTLHSTLSRLPTFSGFDYWQLFLLNLAFYLLAIAGFYLLTKRAALEKGMSLAVILTMVFAVHGVNYDYALVLVPVYFLLEKVKTSKINIYEISALFILLLTPVLFALEISFYASYLLFLAGGFLIADSLVIFNPKLKHGN